ncbi:hypothetical protein TSUD_424910, partial [Trifolium subterraneum]
TGLCKGSVPEVVKPVEVAAAPSSGRTEAGAWGSDFDPSAFISEHLALKGDSSKFDAMEIPELRKLCIGQGLKSVVLSHLMSVRQDKEVQEADAKVVELEKTVSTLQSRHDKEEARLKKEIDYLKKEKEADANKRKKDKEDSLAELQMKHDAAVDLLNKQHAEDVALLGKAKANLTRLRNACIVALCQQARDAALTSEDVKDLEDENAALKEEMADKYVDG